MSHLYTVRMFREHKVYSYDDRGRRVNERVEQLEVVVTDLPHVTAIGYQFKFPKNGVRIEQQIGEYAPPRSAKRDYYERDDEAEIVTTEKRDAIVDAAIRGDLAAAISGEAA